MNSEGESYLPVGSQSPASLLDLEDLSIWRNFSLGSKALFDYHLSILVSKGVGMARARGLMTDALREALRRRRISPTRAAKNAGLFEDALAAAFRGARSLSLEEIDRVIDANDIPFEELLAYMTSACRPLQKPLDPVAIVASFKQLAYPGYPDLRIWLTAIPKAGSGEAPASLPTIVREIEEVVSNDREDALERARIWVSTYRNRLRGASRGQRYRAEAVCEFAMALGMWGWVASTVGLVNDAAFALEHALRLHGAFPLSRGYSKLLHWASYLALPAGSPESGVQLSERALLILASLGDTKAQCSVLVNLAAMKGYCGLDLEAGEIAGAILENQQASIDNRFSAYLMKVQAALLKEDFLEARRNLDNSQKLLDTLPPQRKIFYDWWRGRIEASTQNFDKAMQTFSMLLQADSGLMETGDRFLIFIDFAESAKALGDFDALKTEAKKMQKWLPLLDISNFSRAIIAGFSRIVQQRLPDEAELQEAKSAMATGARMAPAANKNEAQPQGSGIGPSSGSSP